MLGENASEIKCLEQIQANMLKGILGLPSSTPYIGILMEMGIQDSTLIFYHSIISSEERLVTDVVMEQDDKHCQNSFVQRVSPTEEELRTDTQYSSVKVTPTTFYEISKSHISAQFFVRVLVSGGTHILRPRKFCVPFVSEKRGLKL